MMNEKFYVDERYPDEFISEYEMKVHYAEAILQGDVDPSEVTFQQHLTNCMQENNGTLSVFNGNILESEAQ